MHERKRKYFAWFPSKFPKPYSHDPLLLSSKYIKLKASVLQRSLSHHSVIVSHHRSSLLLQSCKCFTFKFVRQFLSLFVQNHLLDNFIEVIWNFCSWSLCHATTKQRIQIKIEQFIAKLLLISEGKGTILLYNEKSVQLGLSIIFSQWNTDW